MAQKKREGAIKVKQRLQCAK